MTNKKKIALECLWEEAKMYSKLYHSTNDEEKRHKYISHFRSPIYDETDTKMFKRDFISVRAFNNEGRVMNEHCNGRTQCSKILIQRIHKKEINNFNQFVDFLVNYCYTIRILSEENYLVAQYIKKNKDKNFLEAYRDLGITLCDNKGNIIKEPNLPII